MGVKLKIKPEYINSEVHFEFNGASRKVVLNGATQEQLAMIKELGYFDHMFEGLEPKEKK
jgi:hypothetical protein